MFAPKGVDGRGKFCRERPRGKAERNRDVFLHAGKHGDLSDHRICEESLNRKHWRLETRVEDVGSSEVGIVPRWPEVDTQSNG